MTSGSPLVAGTRHELVGLLGEARRTGGQVALVPTMGALHDGHASLIRRARADVGDQGRVVVSIFVNPTQFGPGDDLDRYPRTLDADLAVCAQQGADLVFAPSVEEVYPRGVRVGSDPDGVTVEPGPLGNVLEGAIRPGHFRGVLTVVAKLLGLTQPDVLVLGEKDYQQLVLVGRMVADLCLPVRVVGSPTVREPDGLALSSRNRYLDAADRRRATVLSRALRAAQHAQRAGAGAALAAARAELAASGVEPDYVVVTDPGLGQLPDPPSPGTPARVLVAARLGGTRLIDNSALVLGRAGAPAGRGGR